MKFNLFCVVVVLLTSASLTIAASSENDSDDYVPYEGQRYDNFDWQLFKALKTSEDGNLIISPISVKMLLAMLYEGAAGETEKELSSVLQLPISRQATRDRFHQIITSLQSSADNYILEMGSRLFLDSSILPQQRFTSTLKIFYNTSVESLNFDNANEAKNHINNWAKNITRGHVNNLVDEKILQDAILLITNAIYFQGVWRTPFPRNYTVPANFYITPNDTVIVPFMSNYGRYYYAESDELNAKILRFPYKGKHMAMYIILPNISNDLQHVIKNINPRILKRIQWVMDKRYIHVYLPKFEYEFNAKLSETLQILGLHHMFQNTASLPGIARGENGKKQLVVSEVVQKSGIKLNEEGSTVWAATEVALGNKFGSPEITFNASHPFLFYIEDELTGTILFAGKIGNPGQSETLNENI